MKVEGVKKFKKVLELIKKVEILEDGRMIDT